MGGGLLRLVLAGLGLSSLVIGVTWMLLYASLPIREGNVKMKGLSGSGFAEFDQYGIPRIQAGTREDAYRILGFVTAQDRLFQMDLLRRKMAGRLAEVFGDRAVNSDRWHRIMGFNGVASKIISLLPANQKTVLKAYSEGVNQAIDQYSVLPFEFLLLGYSPDPWSVEDSLLAVLGMETTLTWRGDLDRMISVMRVALPREVADFLLPKTDVYTNRLLHRDPLELIGQAVPVEEIASVLHCSVDCRTERGVVRTAKIQRGSNAWLVGSSKTKVRKAILANDMHLKLNVPNIWYRAELHYGNTHLAGITLPGLPLIISGSNRRIAWGFTASGADNSDLVLVDTDPDDPSKYLSQQGSLAFGERTETIRIRGKSDEILTVRTTEWGPILSEELLGKPVAVRWATLDPLATNLDFLNLDRINTVQEALPLMNRAGAPVLHAMVADAEGNIGWTMTGRIPIRFGMDGLESVSWANGKYGWKGYIAPDDLPRSVNPPSGFLVSANQTMVGADYPYPAVSSYDWRGNRAQRITESLERMQQGITENKMLALQMDTETDFYDFYQRLALSVMDKESVRTQPELESIRQYVIAWNGHSGLDSKGLGLLVEFRKILADEVLSPLMAPCRELDPDFNYRWPYFDVPLERILDAKLPELLPYRDKYSNWDELIKDILLRSANNLVSRYHVADIRELTWGRINQPVIEHPLSSAIPSIRAFLNMPEYPSADCDECMGSATASERLVISPGHNEFGSLVIPTGQSGHPLSRNYADQHLRWAEGSTVSFWVGKIQTRIHFISAAELHGN